MLAQTRGTFREALECGGVEPPLWEAGGCDMRDSITFGGLSRFHRPPKAAARCRAHFHEKAIICQLGIGRAPWRSSDAAPSHLLFEWLSFCFSRCRSDESSDPHFHPHLPVRHWDGCIMRFAPVRRVGCCYLQVDVVPRARSCAWTQSPSFELSIHAAGNAVAGLLSIVFSS